MRQAGIIAAGGIYALEHHVDRLAEDHANAKLLANRLKDLAPLGISINEVQTNIVVLDVSKTGHTPQEISARLLDHGLRLSIVYPATLRAVTHLDVNPSQIEEAAGIIQNVFRNLH
ncbi:MAG: beta-eliminating lyase-related protein [Terriglobia bacterium]